MIGCHRGREEGNEALSRPRGCGGANGWEALGEMPWRSDCTPWVEAKPPNGLMHCFLRPVQERSNGMSIASNLLIDQKETCVFHETIALVRRLARRFRQHAVHPVPSD